MTGSFHFWDLQVWSFIITISLLMAAMLLANVFRRKISFFKKSLLPSSVVGGFLALFANFFWEKATGNNLFDLNTLEMLTYHGLGLGFIALSWRHLDGIKGKKARRDVFCTASVTVGAYLLQAVLGLIISVILFYLMGSFAAGGILLPMGYGQGPGQAFNWGTTYEKTYGFVNGKSYGLTIAAMGFVSACVGGLIYLNKLSKSEKYKARAGEIKDNMTISDFCGDNEIPVSESMDKLTIQFGLVFLTYAIAYFSMWLVYRFLLLPLGGFAMNTVNPLIWGFNFLIGTAWAILLKNCGNLLRKKGIMHREYTNNYLLNRISGFMFDLMVVASIAAIDLSAFRYKSFWLPLLLECILGAFATYFYIGKVCKKLFPDYSDEMFLGMYGMLTGTASTGIILLREIDPLYKTPASHNLIYQNLWAIVLGAPMLLLLGFVPKSMASLWIGFSILAFMLIVILFFQFKKRNK